jgi:outer membrane lipopolysaccharide assembly protein LptE/RlpB
VKTGPLPKLSRIGVAITALLIAVGTAGCGYHLAASGDALPQTAKTIYVQKFANHTRFTGINDQLMRCVKDEIASHDRLQLVDSPSQADLVLSGSVNFADSVPSTFNSVLEPTIYNQSMSVSAELRDRHDNRLIWSARGISNYQKTPVVAQAIVTTTPTFLQQNLRGQDYAQMQDIQVAQSQSSSAQVQMMQQIAQNLYSEMAEGF